MNLLDIIMKTIFAKIYFIAIILIAVWVLITKLMIVFAEIINDICIVALVIYTFYVIISVIRTPKSIDESWWTFFINQLKLKK